MSAFLTDCSVTRRAEKTSGRLKPGDDAAGFYDDIRANNITAGNFYISKANLFYEDNDISLKLVAGIKFRYPDSLLVSLRSKLGIEAARVFITGDTIIINDRINRRILYGDPSALANKYGFDPDVIYVLFGDFIGESRNSGMEVKCREGKRETENILDGTNLSYTIDCDRKKAISAIFNNDLADRRIELKFDGYNRNEGKPYPENIEIVYPGQMITLGIDIERIETGWEGKLEFVPGKNYKLVKIK